MIHFETGVTESPKDTPEGKWVLSGGTEIPCIYEVYGRINQKSYLHKKIKGTKFFLIHCSFLNLKNIKYK